MTQSKNSSLIQLSSFPSWAQEDLLNVLNEAGGDVYVAISRISEGHVSQWSDSSKKAAMTTTSTAFESRPSRTDHNDRSSRNNNGSNNRNNTSDKARTQRPRDRPQTTTTTTTARRAYVPAKAPASPKTESASNNELSWGESTEQVVPVAPLLQWPLLCS